MGCVPDSPDSPLIPLRFLEPRPLLPGRPGGGGRRGPRPPLRDTLRHPRPAGSGGGHPGRRHHRPVRRCGHLSGCGHAQAGTGALRGPHARSRLQTPTGSRKTPRARPGATCWGNFWSSTCLRPGFSRQATPRPASRRLILSTAEGPAVRVPSPVCVQRTGRRRSLPLPPRFGPGAGRRSRPPGLALCG